ncbi:MAG: arsenate reductase (glutaredoxin) [Alphaproteobacteria bacterium]|nr:arsenate reductase (glutaredoxin) [Alphaproteobacteria bacterium]
MSVTIYHNPRCSKSRQTLELLKANGIEPVVIEYLTDVPSVDELRRIIALLGITPRELMRPKEAAEVGLDINSLSDDSLLDGMSKHPTIIQRPIVVSGEKAAIGRPPECVLGIL